MNYREYTQIPKYGLGDLISRAGQTIQGWFGPSAEELAELRKQQESTDEGRWLLANYENITGKTWNGDADDLVGYEIGSDKVKALLRLYGVTADGRFGKGSLAAKQKFEAGQQRSQLTDLSDQEQTERWYLKYAFWNKPQRSLEDLAKEISELVNDTKDEYLKKLLATMYNSNGEINKKGVYLMVKLLRARYGMGVEGMANPNSDSGAFEKTIDETIDFGKKNSSVIRNALSQLTHAGSPARMYLRHAMHTDIGRFVAPRITPRPYLWNTLIANYATPNMYVSDFTDGQLRVLTKMLQSAIASADTKGYKDKNVKFTITGQDYVDGYTPDKEGFMDGGISNAGNLANRFFDMLHGNAQKEAGWTIGGGTVRVVTVDGKRYALLTDAYDFNNDTEESMKTVYGHEVKKGDKKGAKEGDEKKEFNWDWNLSLAKNAGSYILHRLGFEYDPDLSLEANARRLASHEMRTAPISSRTFYAVDADGNPASRAVIKKIMKMDEEGELINLKSALSKKINVGNNTRALRRMNGKEVVFKRLGGKLNYINYFK